MPQQEIRTILAPLAGSNVLLPNSAVAEVLAFERPDPLKDAPDWLLGELAWHGWQVPVINYLQLIDGSTEQKITKKTRILVIKTLGESTQVNYLGLVIQGLPRLKKVTAKTLIENQTDDLHETLFSQVSIDDEPALIPEIAQLTRIVELAAYGS